LGAVTERTRGKRKKEFTRNGRKKGGKGRLKIKPLPIKVGRTKRRNHVSALEMGYNLSFGWVGFEIKSRLLPRHRNRSGGKYLSTQEALSMQTGPPGTGKESVS